jgi:cyclopropane-fatty-acyl-phospholipid synthase
MRLVSLGDDFFLGLLDRLLSSVIKRGTLTMIDASGRARQYGAPPGPAVSFRLRDKRLYRRILLNPELVVGEAYMDGDFEIVDGTLRDFLAIFHSNSANLRARPVRRLIDNAARKARLLQQYNPVGQAQKNVAHHYDISNDFYKLFLDTDMHYSCAYFERDGQSLEDAQQAKLRHIASKLRLEPGMRVLDIGSGWGGMAMYLAEKTGANVVGVTLSTEQVSLATERARTRGLESKVAFRLQDYRDVEEKFDRIVSVGMFEHVGAPHFLEYFSKVRDLLADDGLALLHSIGSKNTPRVTGPWIRKYIFPGGYSPALSETLAAIEKTGLWVTDIEILRLHYADTLNEWGRRFAENRDTALAMFDERFCRMWEFYLATAEFAFRASGNMVFQIQLAKSHSAVPIRRGYMGERERELAAGTACGPDVQ